MNRSLDALSARFRPKAVELLARAVEADLAIRIIQTLRTPEEHAANLAKKVSWIAHSRHLDGDAIDLCPYDIWDSHGPNKLAWDGSDPSWAKLAAIGRSLGLRCGYDWAQRDLGHFEYADPPVTVEA